MNLTGYSTKDLWKLKLEAEKEGNKKFEESKREHAKADRYYKEIEIREALDEIIKDNVRPKLRLVR